MTSLLKCPWLYLSSGVALIIHQFLIKKIIIGSCFFLLISFQLKNNQLYAESNSNYVKNNLENTPTSNIKIKADIFELDGRKNYVLASGNVIVSKNEVIIYGGYAKYEKKAQKIYVFDNIIIKKGKITMRCDQVIAYGKEEIIEAKDNITFTFTDIVGQAQYAIYDLIKQKITLKGNPEIIQDKDRLVGKIIEIDVKNEKLITKGKARITISNKRFNK
jgi:lipopolysaccharide transport protein LptA